MDTAIEHAADAAVRRDAAVHVLCVIDDGSFLTPYKGTRTDVVEEFRMEGETATTDVAGRLEAAGATVRAEIRNGNPADGMINCPEERDVDLVATGTHGADYRRNVPGIVSQKVVTMVDALIDTVRIDHHD